MTGPASPFPLFTHEDCLRHDPGFGHPERPARLRAVLERAGTLEGVAVHQVEPATREAILRVHPEMHLARLAATSAAGGGMLDPDTILNEESWQAAQLAAGAAIAAVHAVQERPAAFAAVRPPGHHALAIRAMGFCLLNNAVIAAREAQAQGRERVMIVDWDVHHGNGTQALVEQDPSIRYVSLHQFPWYPGTGAEEERGVGNVFNVPRPPGLEPQRYVADLWKAIESAVTDWPPAMVIISAGYDAMRDDPLGGFTLEPEHYAEWIRRLRARLPDVPLVGLLEGGYVPERVADGVEATIEGLRD